MQVDFQKNYFALFGLPEQFELDNKDLHQRLKQIQSALHPDRFVNASDQERRLSVQRAAHVNEAYETLSNPVKRSRYLLQLKGMNVQDDHETTNDTGFLMEQIELREEMVQCRTCSDPLRCCNHLTGKLDQRANEYAEKFTRLLKDNDLEQARQMSKKMQFIERVSEQIDEMQLSLEEELI